MTLDSDLDTDNSLFDSSTNNDFWYLNDIFEDNRGAQLNLEESPTTTSIMPQSSSTAGSIGLPSFPKLSGQDNYSLWKFQMSKFLDYDDLWDITDPEIPSNLVAATDDDLKLKRRKAITKISLMVEPNCIKHIRMCNYPAEMWRNLQTAFEHTGLSRRLRSMRNLFNVRLENYSNIQSYVDAILELTQQISDISDPLDDEFIGILMLNGLTPDFDPMVLAMENSNTKISSDLIKGKLLDQASKQTEDATSQAFFTNKNRFKCDFCNKTNHSTARCFKKKKYLNRNTTTSEDSSNSTSASSSKKGKGF